jgi:hypothetical protein
MKKLLLILLCVPLMYSCGGNKEQTSEDIDLETLKEPCDFVDASLCCVDDLINLAKKYNYEIIPKDSEDLQKIESFSQIFEDISIHRIEIYGEDFETLYEDCKNYDLLRSKIMDKEFMDWCELFPELE